MSAAVPDRESPLPGRSPFDEGHYKDLKRRNIVRLLITYLTPLIVLTGYFFIQYDAMVSEGQRMHLRAIAENQANTLDLFLNERLINLSNQFTDPKFPVSPSSSDLESYLSRLQRSSRAFVDIGYFNFRGIQEAYAGPYPSLEMRNYSTESWYRALKLKDDDFIITDIYLGFRRQPHFTIAVSRLIDGQFVVLRATLSPEKIYDYLTGIEESGDVFTAIVNTDGYYQMVTPNIGTPLETASIVPPQEPSLGVEKVKIGNSTVTYAYSWLRMADWALTVQFASGRRAGILSGFGLTMIAISIVVVLLILVIIINRARKLVDMQRESDRTRAQLEHAAKLASVGELAAGIAHEINNPLAAISEEAGLMRDLLNPEFGSEISNEEIRSRLDSISESVFRCRDITRKLLGFVRKTDFDLRPHDVHRLIDGVVDGLLGREIAVSNVEIIRKYGPDVPAIVTDGNQLQQVFLNLINNGVDAITPPGKIVIRTRFEDGFIRIDVSDTGKGISPDQMEMIFMPFYTTKEVGRGTGLGLSVSYGIIKSLGGTISVRSLVGEGSTFSISLPPQPGKSGAGNGQR